MLVGSVITVCLRGCLRACVRACVSLIMTVLLAFAATVIEWEGRGWKGIRGLGLIWIGGGERMRGQGKERREWVENDEERMEGKEGKG